MTLSGETALVTGATGFVGTRIVARLHAEGVAVHAVSRRPPPAGEGVEWHAIELTDAPAVERLLASIRPDLILHLAGDPRAARTLDAVLPTFGSNLVSTVNLLAAAAEHRPGTRVVIAGSLEEPEHADPPSSPYAASKAATRAYARLFDTTFGLTVSVLRVFMVYGPGQRDLDKLVPYTVLSLLRGEPPRLTSGVREIDWVYVDDVADAFVAAARSPDGVYADVGSGAAVSIRALVDRLVELVDPSIEPQFGAVQDRAQEQVRVADVSATEAALGWRPRVSLEDGLERTVAWYREQLGRGGL